MRPVGYLVAMLCYLVTVPGSRVAHAEDTSVVQMFPDGGVYPQYIANPTRSSFSAQNQFYKSTTIAATSRRRFDLKIGALLGIIRRQESNQSHAGMQLDLEAGFHGQFDADHSEDNIGWDGIYGLMFSQRLNALFAYRVGIHHTSSHIGDELIARTGRTRINYTRQETRFGVVWDVDAHNQFYAELGHGHDLRNQQLQKPWRQEIGFQYQNNKAFNAGFGWYGAVDISRYEENNWDNNVAVQFGLVWARNVRAWRVGLEYYDGRNPLGEFFQDQDKYVGFGLWIDI